MNELGLRERKKQQTRVKLADVAFELFAEHGFDRVTVAQVARAADVSEATVFNYFRTKESLFYDGMAEFEAELLAAVRARPPGVSVVDAYREFLLQPRGSLADYDATAGMERLAAAARIAASSAALLAKERELLDDHTARLAELIAAETGAATDDLTPWVVANALAGVHRAMKASLHRKVLAGERGPHLTSDLLAHGEEAFDLLERGLNRSG